MNNKGFTLNGLLSIIFSALLIFTFYCAWSKAEQIVQCSDGNINICEEINMTVDEAKSYSDDKEETAKTPEIDEPQVEGIDNECLINCRKTTAWNFCDTKCK